MSVKILVDMNLTPDWCLLLENAGWRAIHWSTVGKPQASDRHIIDWAAANGYILFTHDLDFGTAVALTHKTGPSILQVRGQEVLPADIGNLVVAAIRQYEKDLESGAIVVIDKGRNRIRILPI